MVDHPIAQCALAGWCGSVGLLKFFDAIVIPEFILYGTAIIVAWQLISLGLKGIRWLVGRPDRSDDGTHY